MRTPGVDTRELILMKQRKTEELLMQTAVGPLIAYFSSLPIILSRKSHEVQDYHEL